MDWVVLAMITANGVLFATMGVAALLAGRRDSSPRVGSLLLCLAIVCGAFTLGAVQRLALQAHRRGWFATLELEQLLLEFQLAKSAVAIVLGIAALMLFRRAIRELRRAEAVAAAFTSRLDAVPNIADLALTARELDVLEVISRCRLSDAEIAEDLQISPLTARTHVRNIMAKAKVSSRRDLLLLAERDSR